MIMNICECLQKTQIKLENLRAKKGIWELPHPSGFTFIHKCVGILRAQRFLWGKFMIIKAQGRCPKEPTECAALNAGSFLERKAHF